MAITNPKFDASEALLAAFPTSDVSKWAMQARAQAAANLRGMGAPVKRDEYWRFTNPSGFTVLPPPSAALFGADEAPMYDSIDRLKLVFVDGVFDAKLSDNLDLDGIEIELLSDALNKDIHWAKDLYGVLEANGQKPVERPMAALNTAVAGQGLVIRATGKTVKPISIRYIHNAETSDAMVHHLVKVDAGACLTILESGPGAARFNSVIEVDVAQNAEFHHIRTQGRDHERRTVTHMFGRLAAQSVFRSFTMTMNGVLTRNECVLDVVGDDAKATVGGVCAGDGSDFHHDDTVFITHGSLNCESRQVFKKVLRNGATGVFQGKILVKQGAQKTDGYQISQGLLLDDDCNFFAKPELEIYADDVICSHGSTVGAIDENALFYLLSRGVPKMQAQDMLILAFLGEAIDEIDNDALSQEIHDRLMQWMERRRD
jgi:Fe-S cluster assembly protein SufD